MKNSIDARLQWFVGFYEGDGSLQVHKGRCFFVLNQKDPQVLNYIKKLLQFGSVKGPYKNKRQNTSYYRYTVSDLKDIKTLIEIFNGNLVLNKTKIRFEKFVEHFNSSAMRRNIILKPIKVNTGTFVPTLNDGWLSGFIDAEGCFSGYLTRQQSCVSGIALTFSLKQKAEEKVFKDLHSLIKGSYSFNEKRQMCELKLAKKSSCQLIIDYLSRYPLQSNKTITFKRFQKVHVRLTDDNFKWRMESSRAKNRLIRLVQDINKI